MFTKAKAIDDAVIFYFDENDRKHVAQGGSLAWRAHNPGLIPKDHYLAQFYHAIGSCGNLAIFPSFTVGMEALRMLLNLPQFRFSLQEIAAHYEPDNPDGYLVELCSRLNLANTDISQFSDDDFEHVVKAVQDINHCSEAYHGTLDAIPRITAHYISHDKNVELYLTESEEFITRIEAIDRVLTYRLDALIAHKADGSVYLRSRKGYHWDLLRLPDQTANQNGDFKQALRDFGEHKPGQCLWGYINGIDNTAKDVMDSMVTLSQLAHGEKIWALVNDKKLIFSLGNLWEGLWAQINVHLGREQNIQVTRFAALFFRLLLKLSAEDPMHPPVIVFVHSQGAVIAKMALHLLTPEERREVRIFSFGGGIFIFPEEAHPETHNYIGTGDLVPRFAVNASIADFALKKYHKNRAGYSDEQIIEEMIQEDVDNNLATLNPEIIAQYSEEQHTHYSALFEVLSHITVLEEKDMLGHAFTIPTYQNEIAKIIKFYSEGKAEEII